MNNYTTPSDKSDGTDERIDKQAPVTDGGTEVIVAGDDAELIDENDDRIEGPFPEFNKYGNYTGENYWRCGNCGAESIRQQDLDTCCGEGR